MEWHCQETFALIFFLLKFKVETYCQNLSCQYDPLLWCQWMDMKADDRLILCFISEEKIL